MIDLHIHTTFSDGTDTYEEILKKAQEKKLSYISFTDHNNCYVYRELEKIDYSKYYKGKIIPGIELSTTLLGVTIEILGYGVDINYINEKIHELYPYSPEEIEIIEIQRAEKLYSKAGIILDKDVKEKYNKEKYQFSSTYLLEQIKKHTENSKFFKNKEVCQDSLLFYRRCMKNPNSIFYIPTQDLTPTCKQVIELIRKSGGLAFAPHIYIYKENAQKILEELVNHYKIDGVECYYSLFNEQKIEEITQYAKEHNLYMSGGTDYHGKNKHNIKLGTGIYDMHIPETILNNWINKVKYLNPQNFVMN